MDLFNNLMLSLFTIQIKYMIYIHNGLFEYHYVKTRLHFLIHIPFIIIILKTTHNIVEGFKSLRVDCSVLNKEKE